MSGLRVTVRVGGETRGRPTYDKLVEDLARAGLGGAGIVEAGFAGYRTVPVTAVVPVRPLRETVETVVDRLIGQLTSGLGVDPRSLAGRLFVTVDPPDAKAPVDVSVLEREGYEVEATSLIESGVESCEVALEVVPAGHRGAAGTRLVRFVATRQASGGGGAGVAESRAWHSYLNRYVGLERGPEAAAALQELVRRLLDDGWHPVGPAGPFWYSERFERASGPR